MPSAWPSIRVFALAIAFAASGFALAACDGDDPAPQATLPEGAVELDSEEREITIQPGESFGIDTVDYAGDREVLIPGCAAYIFAYAWNATEPEGGVPLRIDSTRQGETTVVSEEASGSATAGCAFLEFINTGDVDVVLDLSYIFGEQQ